MIASRSVVILTKLCYWTLGSLNISGSIRAISDTYVWHSDGVVLLQVLSIGDNEVVSWNILDGDEIFGLFSEHVFLLNWDL
jgi:hypothetical protein